MGAIAKTAGEGQIHGRMPHPLEEGATCLRPGGLGRRGRKPRERPGIPPREARAQTEPDLFVEGIARTRIRQHEYGHHPGALGLGRLRA